ncbi:MAG: glycoside hydrolase family 2, partial [Sphingobacteriaceae bacterium]
MKPLLLCLSYLLITHITFAQENSLSNTSRTRIIDNHWYFKKDTLSDYKKLGFDDSSWRFLNLPHDWSIEDLPNQLHDSISGPFSKASIGKGATAYTVGGIGWYRKKFSLNKSEEHKIVYLNFDGVYMNATVWLNGHNLGNHPYGYTPFNYNITPYLKPAGQENQLTVQVKNTGKNSRWYSGSGIYRHVSLTYVNPVHIIPNGVQVLTGQVSDKSADVNLISTIKNQQSNTSYQIKAEIYDSSGKMIKSSNAEKNISTKQQLENLLKVKISNPKLWSTENPYLYKATIKLLIKNKICDSLSVRFGVRSISINSKTGLVLNGKLLKLKGGCIHHDNGPLGVAAIDRAEERKVELLKANGFNAVRTSHNPPSETFLNACDRLGMLVLDEAFDMWNVPKNPDDYNLYFKDWWEKDLTSIIVRDRNHPSVILWSIGNEIPERADAAGLLTTKMLADKVHQLDPSRMITEAVCSFWDKGGDKNYTWDSSTPPVFKLLDVGGYNYEMDKYEPDHAKYPQRTM